MIDKLNDLLNDLSKSMDFVKTAQEEIMTKAGNDVVKKASSKDVQKFHSLIKRAKEAGKREDPTALLKILKETHVCSNKTS